MKNKEFEVKLLLKQNTEMASKLQTYRRENQQLAKKNQDLNVWVQNLSQVFVGISTAWKTITDNEEALYSLLKRRSDSNSKAIISKYMAHFKTFENITNNLGERITNSGHSEAVTLDAKASISAFVSNYHLFFMQFVQTFFKFNDEYLGWVTDVAKMPDLQQTARIIANKEMENRQKIKDFEAFILQVRQNAKNYEVYGQHRLLDGIISIKNDEIQKLKEINSRQSRKIQAMMDYNSQNTENIIEDDTLYECFCGGVQLKYFKQTWENSLINKIKLEDMVDQNSKANGKTGSSTIKHQEFELLESQKQLMVQKNASLQAKIQKMKIKNKLNQDSILSTHTFNLLRSQCQDLIDYSNSLLGKLAKSNEYLMEIEKSRTELIQELKRKLQKNGIDSSKSLQNTSGNNVKAISLFKNDLINNINLLKKQFMTLNQKSTFREQGLLKSKELMKIVKKQNQELNKKLNDYLSKQMQSKETLEFRHDKFNELQVKINEILKNTKIQEIQAIKKNWQSFVEYVKSRDKKIRDLQSMIRKKQKEFGQKEKLEEVLKESLSQTENVYLMNKEKLDKFEEFMLKTQKEIIHLAEENYRIKVQFQQEKNILTMRLKSQTDIRNRYQQKVKSFQRIEQQIAMMRKCQEQIQHKSHQFLTKQKQKNNSLQLQNRQKSLLIENLKRAISQGERSIQRLTEDKEKMRSEINRQLIKIKQMEEKSEHQILKIELQEYKRKIMCTCGSDRQREVALKTCPHVFCRKCIDDTQSNRSRKCPLCQIKFTKQDIHQICLN